MTKATPAGGNGVIVLYNVHPAWPREDRLEVEHQGQRAVRALRQLDVPVIDLPVRQAALSPLLAGYEASRHFVFNWVEALPGVHHGEVQAARTLQRLKYSFTGSPADVLALSTDKPGVHEVLNRHGIPCPAWRVFPSTDISGWKIFPAIVKPAFEHCSIGISSESVVNNRRQLRQRIRFILERYDQPALVEDFIDGREFHVSLWGNGRIEVLPVAEMDFSAFSDFRDRLCTYRAKFSPASRAYREIRTVLPARLRPSEMDLLRRTCIAAFRSIGCRDYARIDIRLRDGVFFVLDVNPNADISPDTSFSSAAAHNGYPYGAMIRRLLRIAAWRTTAAPDQRNGRGRIAETFWPLFAALVHRGRRKKKG